MSVRPYRYRVAKGGHRVLRSFARASTMREGLKPAFIEELRVACDLFRNRVR